MGLTERIIYGFHECNFGEMIIAQSDRGVCRLGFVREGETHKDVQAQLQDKFPNSSFLQNNTVADNLGRRVLRAWNDGRECNLDIDLRGSDFQLSVWNALLDIGRGYVCSYSEVAQMIGKPDAVRAVASAVGANPVSIIVPCHRVIQKSGKLGEYVWGEELKKTLLLKEGIPREKL